MEKPPAFQFYPADFISDEKVAVMTLEERGAYITLLCYCWLEGSIPADEAQIARLLGVDSPAMARLWPGLCGCFISHGESDRLVNPRLQDERLKQVEYRKTLSNAGKKGAIYRWRERAKGHRIARPKPGHGDPNGHPNAIAMRSDSSSSSSSSSTPSSSLKEKRNKKKKEPADNNFSLAFLEAFTAYPGRPNNPQKAAWKQWRARLREGAAEDSLLAATRNYGIWIKNEGKEPQFTMMARTFWGPNGRWEEYEQGIPAASAKQGGKGLAPKANRTDEEYLDLPEWQKRKNESRRKV